MDTKTSRPALAAVCVLFIAGALHAHETGFPEQTLKRVFPEATGFTLRKKTLTPDQVAKIEQTSQSKMQRNDNPLSYYVALGKPADGSGVLGTVVMVDTRGPKGLIDLAVGIRRDGTVAKVVVVENKDDAGLSADGFLNQLKGKSAQSAVAVGKDVQYNGDVKAAQALVNAVRRGLNMLAAATAP
jgi:Na+-translocating ferredoxin:NAD+ oxidoreductase RnfG subunit